MGVDKNRETLYASRNEDKQLKIYAIKDRMIDYFMTPFAAPSDAEVMASISNEINREGNLNAIAAAPHHFEIHCLGEVDDNGNIHAKREFVCDCSNLVRPRRQITQSEAEMASRSASASRRETEGSGSNGSANGSALPQSTDAKREPVQEYNSRY